MAFMAAASYRRRMVTVRRNDQPQPREGVRMTAAERRALRRPSRSRDGLVRALLARGVPAWQLAEVVR